MAPRAGASALAALMTTLSVALMAGGASAQANLFIQLQYFGQDGNCFGTPTMTSTRSLGQCQSSQDGQYGLLYQCVQAQTTVLQLACPGDFQCAGNTANGDCSVNRFEASDCVFSSSVGQYVQITCSAGTVVPTLTGGPARQLRSDNGEIDVRREFIDEASWKAMEAMSVTPLGGDDVTF